MKIQNAKELKSLTRRVKNEELLLSKKDNVIPQVGMGATTGAGSDCYPHTIIEVSPMLDWIIIQADRYEPVEGFNYYSNQQYNYFPNAKGARTKYTLRKNGRYMQDGTPMKYDFHRVAIDFRRYYQDPSF